MATNTEINGKKYFKITRTVGHTFKGGKKVPVRKAFYGRSERDAVKKYDEWNKEQVRAEYEKKRLKDLSTLSSRADEFIETALKVSQKYAEGTKQKYQEAYRCHIKDTDFAKMRINNIRAADIQQFYNSLNISKQTMQNVQKFMSAFWKWMVRNEYADNVLAAVEVPTKPDNKRHEDIMTWTDAEVSALLDASKKSSASFRLSFLIEVLLYTGMRLGEAMALKYSDFHDGLVHIARQYNLGEIKEPKWNSKRQVPIHDDLQQALARHRQWHEEDMRKNGYKTEYVFTTRNGQLYNAYNVRNALRRFYDRNGIAYKSPKDYRSTFCTKLCRAGVSIEVASKLMGHKSILVTSKFYAQIRDDSKKNAIDSLKF